MPCVVPSAGTVRYRRVGRCASSVAKQNFQPGVWGGGLLPASKGGRVFIGDYCTVSVTAYWGGARSTPSRLGRAMQSLLHCRGDEHRMLVIGWPTAGDGFSEHNRRNWHAMRNTELPGQGIQTRCGCSELPSRAGSELKGVSGTIVDAS